MRVAYAKPRQEPRPGRGRYWVDLQRSESPDAGRGADAEREGISDVRKCEGGNVVLKLKA